MVNFAVSTPAGYFLLLCFLSAVQLGTSVSYGEASVEQRSTVGQGNLAHLSNERPIKDDPRQNTRKSSSIDGFGRSMEVKKAGALLKGRQGVAAVPNSEADEKLKNAEAAVKDANSNVKAEEAVTKADAGADGLTKKKETLTPDEEKAAYEAKVRANPWFYACPEWARIAIAFLLVCLMVACVLFLVKQEPGAAFQAIMADEEVQRIDKERAELLAKVAELDAQVSKHEADIEAKRQAEAIEAGQSPEEVFQEKKRKAEEKAMQGEAMLKGQVFEIYNQFAPFLAKKEKLERVMKGGVFEAKEKAQKLAFQKIADVGTEVVSTLECDGMLEELKALSQTQETAEQVTADTPLALLLAGLVAPAMLTGMAVTNKIAALSYFPLLLIFVAVFAIDFGAVCTKLTWFWFITMLVLLASNVCIRLWVAAVAEKTIKQTKATNAQLKQAVPADAGDGKGSSDAANPIIQLRDKLTAHSRDYFRALFSYDTICSTKSYRLLNTITVLVFVCGALGVWISIHNIVDDEMGCKAEMVMSILHIYSFFWIILASWTCVTLAIWAVTIIATNEDFALKMLHSAEKFDNKYMPAGFPFTALLIRAFILRDSSDMTRLEVRTLEKEIKELNEKKEKLEAKKTQTEGILSEKESQLAGIRGDVRTDAGRMMATGLNERMNSAQNAMGGAGESLAQGMSGGLGQAQGMFSSLGESAGGSAQGMFSSLGESAGDVMSRAPAFSGNAGGAPGGGAGSSSGS